MDFELPNLPAMEQLKNDEKWVAWKYVTRSGKQTKPPVNPHNGKLARNNVPGDWGSYKVAVARCKRDKLAGIGYVLTEDDNLTGADLDDVRDLKTGKLVAWAKEIVALAETYVEVSPSGTGLRFFWDGKIAKAIVSKKKSVEIYGVGRYLTITGNHVAGTPTEILPAPKTLAALAARVDEEPVTLTEGKKKVVLADSGGESKWQRLNAAALAALDKWVPALFGKGAAKTIDGRYRISSKTLGRQLQEDLSIAPDGIKDFGLHDMDDPREGKRTPLDLFVEYSSGTQEIEGESEKLKVAFKTLNVLLGNPEPDEEEFEIQVKEGRISWTVDQTQKAIIKTRRPIFVRGGILVTPIWNEYPTNDGGTTKATVFHGASIESLRYMTNKAGVIYLRFDKQLKKLVVIDPPDKVLATMLKLGHWKFPRVSGIIDIPTMRPNGSIIKDRGYDATTQLWCCPDDKLKLPEISDRPSKKEAAAALKLLKELLAGFPLRAEIDLAVALAAIMTCVVRGAFPIAPMVLFLAHMAGTGKSYLVDVISTIVRGRPCPVITASRNEEEMEKRIGSLLLESTPLISLDNLSFDLRSDVLCQMCTQQTVKVRILGKSETPDCEWRGTLFATGNNIRLVGDMTRRGLICNLDAGVERPELREFNFDPIEMVLKDQGKYIAAALTIARAYFVSGESVKCAKIGSYGAWSRFVREPLIWLGEVDPVKSMEQAYHDDPNKEAAERLVEQWKEHLGTNKSYKISEIIELAKETQPGVEFGAGVANFTRVRPDLFDLLVERAGERGTIETRKFGYWLRALRGQIFNNHKVVVATEDASNGNKWRLEALT